MQPKNISKFQPKYPKLRQMLYGQCQSLDYLVWRLSYCCKLARYQYHYPALCWQQVCWAGNILHFDTVSIALLSFLSVINASVLTLKDFIAALPALVPLSIIITLLMNSKEFLCRLGVGNRGWLFIGICLVWCVFKILFSTGIQSLAPVTGLLKSFHQYA